jgi:hypothetical protein
MSEEISQNRRRFLGTAAMSIAAAHLGMTDFADTPHGNTVRRDDAQARREHIVRTT